MELPVVYGQLTWQERRRVRELYCEKQKGLCAHCGESLGGPPRKDVDAKSLNMRRFPKDFLKWPVHLHHCHRTGLTIGSCPCEMQRRVVAVSRRMMMCDLTPQKRAEEIRRRDVINQMRAMQGKAPWKWSTSLERFRNATTT